MAIAYRQFQALVRKARQHAETEGFKIMLDPAIGSGFTLALWIERNVDSRSISTNQAALLEAEWYGAFWMERLKQVRKRNLMAREVRDGEAVG